VSRSTPAIQKVFAHSKCIRFAKLLRVTDPRSIPQRPWRFPIRVSSAFNLWLKTIMPTNLIHCIGIAAPNPN
jgi:hypothetical protein